ncbi:RAP domain-containing protein [Plasmodiophora brassicae]
MRTTLSRCVSLANRQCLARRTSVQYRAIFSSELRTPPAMADCQGPLEVPSVRPHRVVFEPASNASALMAEFQLRPEQLSELLLHTLMHQTDHDNHAAELAEFANRLVSFDLRAISMRTASTILTTIVKYDKRFRGSFSKVIPFIAEALKVNAHLPLVDARHLCQAVHSIAKLGFDGAAARPALPALAAGAIPHLMRFRCQDLSICAWSYAAADARAPALFDAIAREAVGRVKQFNAQGLSNIVWAFAKAQDPCTDLFDAIAAESVSRLYEFQPQNIASMAWAFAKLGHSAPALFDAIDNAVKARAEEFSAQGLANIVWAFARADIASGNLLHLIANLIVRSERLQNEFVPQTLSNVAWAYAKAGVYSPELFGFLSRATIAALPTCNSQNMAMTVWSFSVAGVSAPDLFTAVEKEALKRIREFNPQDLSNTAWGFATSCTPADDLFEAIAHAMGNFKSSAHISDQILINTLFALAIAGHPELGISSGVARMLPEKFSQGFDPVLASHVHMWRMSLSDDDVANFEATVHGAADVLARCKALFSERGSSPDSALFSDIAKAIWKTRFASLFVRRVRCKVTSYLVDFAYEGQASGLKIALLINGKSSFMRNGNQYNAMTLLKQRILSAHGWHIANIDYQDWDAVGVNEPDRIAFINKALGSVISKSLDSSASATRSSSSSV